MNTYDEDLHSTVKELLYNLELEQNKLQSQKKLALAAHGHAQETLAAAKHRSGTINSLLVLQQRFIEKLQEPLFICTTILSSANEANACSKKAVTSSSIAASNIQVAANAVIRLASDIASLYAIVQASGSDNELYKQAKALNTLVTETAFKAETSSQLAMEASVLAAQTTASIVADRAKTVQSQAVEIMNLLVGQCNASRDQQQTIVSELNTAISSEEQARQELEKISAEYAAAQEAYLFAAERLSPGQNIPSNNKVAHHRLLKKERELHLLEDKVLHAQQKADRHQEKVAAHTEKYNLKQEYLTIAETHKGQLLNHKDLVDQLFMNLWILGESSESAFNEAKAAKAKCNETAQSVSTTLDQLLSVAKAADKLQELVIKKKAVNPLITDQLVSLAATVCKDAANALSLSLVALTSAFTSAAANTEIAAVMALEYTQFVTLCEILTKEKDPKKALMAFKEAHALVMADPLIKEKHLKKLKPSGLAASVYRSYNGFLPYCDSARTGLKKATAELESANAKLNASQNNLKSLQAGLTAAKAVVNSH